MIKKHPIRIALLGATGSIGASTLRVISKHPSDFELTAVSAHTNSTTLDSIVRKYHPKHVCITGDAKLENTKDLVVHRGQEGLCELATLPEVDVVVVAVLGFAAMRPIIAGTKAHKRIACANKEALVCAGDIIMALLDKNQLIPVDSEHSALFQCLQGEENAALSHIWLTCSGGPFLNASYAELASVTPEQALAHPKWSMGDKITIDSATLMNKGLEVIEAYHLFSVSYDQISVLIHPESIVHSMVSFSDGSTKAQLGPQDMAIPIQYALTYPSRIPSPSKALDFYALDELHFARPDVENFRCLELARSAGITGGTAPCIMNAANEVANAAFRSRQLPFLAIPEIIEKTLEHSSFEPVQNVEQLESVDANARTLTTSFLKEYV